MWLVVPSIIISCWLSSSSCEVQTHVCPCVPEFSSSRLGVNKYVCGQIVNCMEIAEGTAAPAILYTVSVS